MFTTDTARSAAVTGAVDWTLVRIARWGVRHYGKLFRDPYRGTVGRLREVEGLLAVLRTRQGLEVACSVRHLVDAAVGDAARTVLAPCGEGG
ncbi:MULTISPECIES: hypothetical protein [unclassified Embleya]|uniref:hypothetical protein n=1 Tax=Embleya sp. NPDC127516 TaxID=3363990 RepID=UPI0037FA187A